MGMHPKMQKGGNKNGKNCYTWRNNVKAINC